VVPVHARWHITGVPSPPLDVKRKTSTHAVPVLDLKAT
jgi:hypothetical protein